MTQPDLKRAKVVESYSRQEKSNGYVTYHRAYDIGRRTLAQENLEPLDGLPEDLTIIIVASRIGKIPGEASERAIVEARTGDYLQAVQTRTGTVTGVKDNGTTTVTATTPIFYPSIVGKDVVITDTGTFAVASYTSATEVVVTGDATCEAKAIAFDEGSRLLSAYQSDSQRLSPDRWWTISRRYHCLTGDRDAEVRYLETTSYTFASDANSVVGYVAGIISYPKDSMVPANSLIAVTYQAPVYVQAVQTRTGTVTGVKDNGTTTVTATTPIFYPSIVGKDVVITDTGTFAVASYTSATEVVVTGDATCEAKAIAFDEGSRLLSAYQSDSQRLSPDRWWTISRRYHCLTGDRDAEVRYLETTSYTFASDANSVVGYVAGIISYPKDSMVPANSLIAVTYQAPVYDI